MAGFGSVGGFVKAAKPAAPKPAPGFSGVGGFVKGPSLQPPRPPALAPWHAGSGTMLGRNINPGASFTQTGAAAAPPKASPQQAAGAANGAGNGSGGAPVDPYDSQYYIDLAAATQRANNQVAGYQKDIGDSRVNLQTNLQNLAHQLALQNTAAQNAENARGGFAQGALGTTLGNIGYANQARASAATTLQGQHEQAWNNAISAAQQGLSTEQIALGLASAGRKATLVANSQGTLGTDAPAAPTAPAAPAAKPPASKTGPVPVGPPKSQGVTRKAPPKKITNAFGIKTRY